jgi:siroheme synthase
MGLHHLTRICRELMEHGKDPRTPVAIISKCTLPEERVYLHHLSDFAGELDLAAIEFPAITIVGDVVRLLPERDRVL